MVYGSSEDIGPARRCYSCDDVWSGPPTCPTCHPEAMPSAPLRPCSTPGCPALVRSGACPTHAQQHERTRGTPTERGYTSRWVAFTHRFVTMLIAHDIPPVCGAALPEGPHAPGSRCQTEGILTFQNTDGSRLHTDHEPPLTPAERQQPATVCDHTRVRLLCRECHSAVTREQLRGQQ